MITYLKHGVSQAAANREDSNVRAVVEQILESIEHRGDVAVREYSEKFDRWRSLRTFA
jgi:sulfopropanediol 3-dehydrogenase